ncbi:MAG TPA: hypothetical protein VHC20_01560 [Candidatus Paceibacterota bacterium]|nr:hypothetical protein [Candidatus Paceibacterota bacterium]
MPFDCCPALLNEVLLDWYRSEADVDWQTEHREPFERQRGMRPEVELADEAVRYLKGSLLQCRSDPRPFFDLYQTSWFKAYVTLQELMTAIAIDSWGRPAPGTIGEVAPRSGVNERPVPRSAGRLILLSTTDAPGARLILLDGYRRSERLIDEALAMPIPVFWGVCEQLAEWDYYR